MKNPNTRLVRASFLPLASLAFLCLTGTSPAALIVQESFDGYAVGDLSGQAANGLGLTGNWEGAAELKYQSPGLSMTGVYSSGGSANLNSGGNFSLQASASFGAALPTGQLYGGYLFSTTTHTNARTVGALTVGSATDTDNNASFVWAGNGYNSSNSMEGPNIRAEGTGTPPPTVSLTGDQTYLMLFEFNAGTQMTTAWVLNQGQITNFLNSNGLISSTLNGAAEGTGNSEVVWKGSVTGANIGVMSHLNLRGLQGANNPTFNYQWDEFRVSDTSLLEAVTVPEPSVSLLGFLGVLGLLRRRR